MELWVPGSTLDRVGDQRLNPAWVQALWEGSGARVLRIGRAQTVETAPGGGLRLARPDGAYDPQRHHLVGLVDGAPVFTVETDLDDSAAPVRTALVGLDDTARDLATTALALVNWHRVAPHCGVCGSPTQVRQAGHVRYCATCERERYPRTDPAVITAIVDPDDRLLLAHNAAWDSDRMSLIAGFVDAGESLEQAVRRESAEEVGVELASLAYVSSQPWPFPRSLMVGFAARAASDHVQVDGSEIDRARWFTRDDYDAWRSEGRLGAPTSISIASSLIGLWRAGELPPL